jgi:hypothetical protein
MLQNPISYHCLLASKLHVQNLKHGWSSEKQKWTPTRVCVCGRRWWKTGWEGNWNSHWHRETVEEKQNNISVLLCLCLGHENELQWQNCVTPSSLELTQLVSNKRGRNKLRGIIERERSENPKCTRPIYEEKVTFIENKYNVLGRKWDR